MKEDESTRQWLGPGVIDSAEVMLVADEFAGTGGETLAASALALWRLPMQPGTRRMRALVTGAAAATSPLRRLCARLVLLAGVLLLEVVFLDAEPDDYENELMPDGAQWCWRRDSTGLWSLCDHVDLRPRPARDRITLCRPRNT